jgi:hypothetical protein
MPERKAVNSEFYMQVLERLLKWILRVRLAISRERQLIPSAQQCLCSFCCDTEVLPGKSWHDGDQPPTLFT